MHSLHVAGGVAATSSMLAAVLAFAAEPHGSDNAHRHVDEEVVVRAHPLQSTTAHVAQPVAVLDAEALARRDMRSIGETVGREPGVTSADFGPSIGRPVIRGLGGARVGVLTDGIGTMDVSTISPDHAVAAEPIFARQVEIFRGPATLAYGSGASSGLVNVVSDRILDYVPAAIEGGLYAHYDSASDGWQGAFSANAGARTMAFHLEGMKRDTGDYDIPGFGERDPAPGGRRGTLSNSDSETEALTGGASWVGGRGFLGFSVGGMDNDYGVPGGHGHEEEEEEADGAHAEQEGGVRITQQQLRADLAAALEAPLPGIERVRTRWGYNDHEHAEVEPEGAIGTRLENEEWEGRLEALHRPLGGWRGALGLQYRYRDLSSSGAEAFVPPATLESVGVFVLEQRDVGRWHLEAGARFEHQSAQADGARTAEHDVYSLSGGVSLGFPGDHRAGLSLTRAQRAPALEELFAGGPHLATNTFEIGDPDLDEETSTNVDLSLARTAGRWTWRASLFYNRIDDFIFAAEQDLDGNGVADRVQEDFSGDAAAVLPADETGELLLVRQTQTDAELYGFEAETVLNLFDDARGHADLRLWADYVRGKRTGGDSLPRIPPLRFSAGLDWWRGPWSAGLEYLRVTRQDDAAPLETETPGYDMLDVHAAWSRSWGAARLRVFLHARNLLDEEARRHVSFLKDRAPLPGRAVLLGLRIEL